MEAALHIVDMSAPIPKKKTTWWRNCVLTIIAIPAFCLCLFVSWWRGGDINRWIKSFEFPFIEARSKPIADELATVTSDALIDESHSIDNVTMMTNDDYTGEVAGDFTKIFATDRTFGSVLDDYARFFSSKPDWDVNKERYALALKTDYTAKVMISIAEKDTYLEAWAKYPTVYEVTLVYGDPKLPGG